VRERNETKRNILSYPIMSEVMTASPHTEEEDDNNMDIMVHDDDNNMDMDIVIHDENMEDNNIDVVHDEPIKTPLRQKTVSTVASNGSCDELLDTDTTDVPQVVQDDEDDNDEDDNDGRSDGQLLAEGERLCHDDQILPGARLLRRIKATSLITAEHTEFLRRADMMEQLREDLLAPSSEGWTKQGESHGNRDFIVYYKIEDGGKLKCRIECVIEGSLYVPFLAVLNETDLYETWFPKWTFPFQLGINRSNKLQQRGRVEQVVQLTLDLPWPVHNREIIFWGFAEEDADANRTVGAKLVTVQEDFDGGQLVPPAEKGIVRMDFEADFMFRPCPPDHAALSKSTAHYPVGENLILLTTVLYCDPKIAYVPRSFMNFCTRTAIGTIWRMLLQVSEDVREGKRPVHADLIARKRQELYDWVEERAVLISGMQLPPKTCADEPAVANDTEEEAYEPGTTFEEEETLDNPGTTFEKEAVDAAANNIEGY
jgi:hypothetical protein